VLTPVKTRNGNKFHLGKLNRIKVLSPVPNNDCFSPSIERKMKEPPKSYIDYGKINLSSLDNSIDTSNQKIYPTYQTPYQNGNVHDISSSKNEQVISPILHSRNRSSIRYGVDLEESQLPPIFTKENKCTLPLIIDPKRKGRPAPVKVSANHFKIQNVDEKVNFYKLPRGQDPHGNIVNKNGINSKNVSVYDESISKMYKAEVLSAGLESQRNPGSRFKAEEMILNKIFRSGH
jgi:hypothetical protein